MNSDRYFKGLDIIKNSVFNFKLSVDYLGDNYEALLARPQVERDTSSAEVEQLRRLHLVTSRLNTVHLVP